MAGVLWFYERQLPMASDSVIARQRSILAGVDCTADESQLQGTQGKNALEDFTQAKISKTNISKQDR